MRKACLEVNMKFLQKEVELRSLQVMKEIDKAKCEKFHEEDRRRIC